MTRIVVEIKRDKAGAPLHCTECSHGIPITEFCGHAFCPQCFSDLIKKCDDKIQKALKKFLL